MSKTTLDLSTLSDIIDGAHTVKVKAKASGYNDSEFSNEVSYTKAPAGHTLTLGTGVSPYSTGGSVSVKFNNPPMSTTDYDIITPDFEGVHSWGDNQHNEITSGTSFNNIQKIYCWNNVLRGTAPGLVLNIGTGTASVINNNVPVDYSSPVIYTMTVDGTLSAS